MNVAERDKLLIELKTVIIGMKGSEEDGMAGDIKEIKRHIADQNGKVDKNTTFRKVGTWIGGILFIAILTLVGDMIIGG